MKDYLTIGVLKHHMSVHHRNLGRRIDHEGLPNYWGIETCRFYQTSCAEDPSIRQDYPIIEVLKPDSQVLPIRFRTVNQEGLPAYWGIETHMDHGH